MGIKFGHSNRLSQEQQEYKNTTPVNGKSPNDASKGKETIQGHCNRYLCISYMLRTVVYSAVFVLFLCTMYPSIIAVDVSLYIDCCVIVCQFRSKPIFVRVAASPVPRYVQILFEKSEGVLFH